MLHLLTLNVERSAHLDRFIPFLCAHGPDVVCLQELVESDIETICSATGLAHCHFVPMARFSPDDAAAFGVGILSRHSFAAADAVIYAGGGDGATVIDRSTPQSRFETMRYVVARARVAAPGFDATIATTHFPWTEAGSASDFQHEAADRMIDLLGDEPVLLCGDFNAPRGGPVFDRLAQRWTDCIPAGVSTSIDPDLHRAGALDLMVDGIFASPELTVSDVRMHTGLSDHQGISAAVCQAPRK